ncbi:MAG: sulfotransferase [Fimbriimonas sp.]|nr:sulfotransferase [Fimbriimonas sp.]
MEANAKNLIRVAQAADAAGQIQRAVLLCNEALRLDDRCVEALLLLGSLAARHGQAGEAEQPLRRAFELDPQSYDAARWLATLLIGKHGGADAVKYGHHAVRLRPDAAEAHVALGLAAMGLGDSTLTIESFSRAVEIQPDLAGAYHNLGVAFQREDSYEEAIRAFRSAIELAPWVFESYIHLGRCYLATDQGYEALACARKAIDLRPDSLDAKRLLADARFVAVLGPNGLDLIREFVEDDPGSAFPHALMGSRLQEQGSFTEAEQSLRQSIELQPIQGFAYYVLANNRKMSPDDRELFASVEHDPRNADLLLEERQYLHFGLGKAYDDLGDYERAMRHFDLAHEQEGPKSSLGGHAKRVHRLVSLFRKETIAKYASCGFESAEPIFIFGMPRSGTTLLEQIVSRHSTVGAGGELFFWRDNCRRIIHLNDGAIAPPLLERAGCNYLDLIRSLAPGKEHVTDKFPSNFAYLGLLHIVFPNSIFIHARRNPLDTCLSIYMRPFSTNQGLGRTRHEIVESYRLYREAMKHWREVLGPSRILDVDYEEMVRHPVEMTRRVVSHCGLDWEDACLKPEESDRRVVTFSKWQVRQPVYTSSVERWRRYEPWLGEFAELLEDS